MMKIGEQMLAAVRAAGPREVFGVFTARGVALAVQQRDEVLIETYDDDGGWFTTLSVAKPEVDFSDVDDFLAAMAREDAVRIASTFEDNLVLHGRGLLSLSGVAPTIHDVMVPSGLEALDFTFPSWDESGGKLPQFMLRVGDELWAGVVAAGPGQALGLVRLGDLTDLWPLIAEGEELALQVPPAPQKVMVWGAGIGDVGFVVTVKRLRSGSHEEVLTALDGTRVRNAITLPAITSKTRFVRAGDHIVMTRHREPSLAWNRDLEEVEPPSGKGELIAGGREGQTIWRQKGELWIE